MGALREVEGYIVQSAPFHVGGIGAGEVLFNQGGSPGLESEADFAIT